jgi:hypothetical protein
MHLVKPTIALRDPYVLHQCSTNGNVTSNTVTVPTGQTSTASFPPSLLKTKSIMGSTISPPETTPTKLTQLRFAEETLRQVTAVAVSICLLTSSYCYVQRRRRASCGI